MLCKLAGGFSWFRDDAPQSLLCVIVRALVHSTSCSMFPLFRKLHWLEDDDCCSCSCCYVLLLLLPLFAAVAAAVAVLLPLSPLFAAVAAAAAAVTKVAAAAAAAAAAAVAAPCAETHLIYVITTAGLRMLLW